ncbi:MAG TPA: ferric reductase-like transmembrane domain-containing protein [Spirochaetota bacterium]|nr:ferric reductase-like transmembrane domain-containing protein [Spirochaetota bacterium]HOL57582.1 ferric reductase-like transmembrane domain-containing protein [Spirochaetota bacterium]HPP05167.1 ferric reductase-like transmembrane domain-containing protein [Spirochaetota bacterium]
MEEFIRNFGRIFGIIGFFLLGFSIFIGGTLRLLDKKFGLDRVLRFHRIFSVISFFLLIFHPFLLFLYNLIKYNLSIIEIYLGYLSLYYFIFGVTAFIFIGISVFISYFFLKKIEHIFWITLHRLNVVFYILALIHLLNFGYLTGFHAKIPILNIFIIISIIMALTGTIVRIIFLIIKPKFISKIIDVIKETDDIHTILVEKPINFTHKSGQFAFISFKKTKMRKPHPFTISSSATDSNLSFSIKSLGEFTSRIKDLNKNEIIKIDGPYGIFNFKGRDSIFIAGGIGITPFKSIIGDKNFNKENKKVILLYGAKTKKDLAFYDFFENYKDKLKIVYILSNEKIDENNFEYGFLSEDILKKYSNFTEDFYLCGPPIMVKKTIEILKRNGVKNIFYEKFIY